MSVKRRGETIDGKWVENGDWFYRFTRNGADFCKGGFPNKQQATEAERLAKNMAIDKEQHPDSYAGQMTFRQAGEWWLANYEPTLRGKVSLWRMPLMMDYFDGKLLKDIQPEDIIKFLDQLPELRKQATVGKRIYRVGTHTRNHYLSLIAALYERLRKERKYKGENPASLVDRIQVPRERCRFMYPAEEKLLTPLLAAGNPGIFAYYRIGLETGMRIGEMKAIQIKHVELILRHIFIPQPKNGKSRYVPIPDALMGLVSTLMDGKGAEDYLLPHWSYNYVKRYFYKKCDEAGVKNLHLHDLRHTFAYNMLSQGEPLYLVSQLMGHSSQDVTQKHYGHLAAEDLRKSIERVKPFLSYNRFATVNQIYTENKENIDSKNQ